MQRNALVFSAPKWHRVSEMQRKKERYWIWLFCAVSSVRTYLVMLMRFSICLCHKVN